MLYCQTRMADIKKTGFPLPAGNHLPGVSVGLVTPVWLLAR